MTALLSPPSPAAGDAWPSQPLQIEAIRRKPGRGLMVVARERCETRTHRARSTERWHITVSEASLLRDGVGATLDAALDALERAGGDDAEESGLDAAFLHFPDDPGLPTLAAAVDVSRGGPVWGALEAALKAVFSEPGWRLAAATATPVRHKPGSRCVIAYRLTLHTTAGTEVRRLTVYGKVLAEAGEAGALDGVLRRLNAARALTDAWSVPAAAGAVEELKLSFSGDAAPPAARDGLVALRPQRRQCGPGQPAGAFIPAETLDAVARGLAQLHGPDLSPEGLPERPASVEADRARRRGDLLAGYFPQLAAQARQTAGDIAGALLRQPAPAPRLCHGGFKPSQLLVAPGGQVGVIDWDGACAADPALDLGYFLAYLRPPALWAGPAGARTWFEAARARFLSTYCAVAASLGADAAGRRQRAGAYEAALLLKIAARRVNRLSSPRPQELTAVLAEARQCLASPVPALAEAS